MNLKPIIVTSVLFVPTGSDAITIWPFIVVRPASRADMGLIEHELVHWREQASSALWWPRYLLSKAFRQAAEVRAYRRQIEVGGLSVQQAAKYLATDYRLTLNEAEAERLLLPPAIGA